jgi:tRNA-splicing ligase RtcB
MPGLKEINNATWLMEKEKGMNVPGIIIGTKGIVDKMSKDKTMVQLRNMASLPGIVKNAVLMPDGHEGYGFPIGGVAGFDSEEGIVSPGGVGYDINCGVRLLTSGMQLREIEESKKELMDRMFKEVPSGLGSESKERVSVEELDLVADIGIDWAIEKDYATEKDKERIEEYGQMTGADPMKTTPTAKARGRRQLGTLGAGNHFLELQYVEKIIYPEIAKDFGLFENQIVVMIHTGSRGYGHQIASDYISRIMKEGLPEGIADPELAYAKLGTETADDYLAAMKCAVNFAFVNRQMITHNIRHAFSKVFGDEELELLYDVAHNIAKFENHRIDGKKKELLIHRKGATRAFPKGREELPSVYMETGQPVIIPGSMGTSSYVLVGEEKGLDVSFGSTCHGAGRALSRHQAMKEFTSESVIDQLSKRNIYFRSDSRKAASEEAPGAYKDIDEIVKSVEDAGISRIVAKLRPIGVVKG